MPNDPHKPLTIALVNPEYPAPGGKGQGGTATYLCALASALAQAGVDVHLCVKQGWQIEGVGPGVTIHWFDNKGAPGLRRYWDRWCSNEITWERGWARGVRETLDTIHAKTPLSLVEFSEYNGLAWGCIEPPPYRVGINFRTPRFVIDRLNNRSATSRARSWYNHERTAVYAASVYRTSSRALRDLVSVEYEINPESIPVIRNPIDTMLFNRVERTAGGKDTFDILFVGRLEARKGAAIIVRDIRKLLDLDPRTQITFAGEVNLGEATSYRETIERVLSDDERTRVWFPGPLRRTELIALYRRSDIFILPSLFDNSPNTLLEAAAARLPVVAAATGGIAELVRHEQNGLLFDPADPGQFVDRVRQLFDNPRLGQTMAQNFYHEITTEYSPRKIAEQTIHYYRSVEAVGQ